MGEEDKRRMAASRLPTVLCFTVRVCLCVCARACVCLCVRVCVCNEISGS